MINQEMSGDFTFSGDSEYVVKNIKLPKPGEYKYIIKAYDVKTGAKYSQKDLSGAVTIKLDDKPKLKILSFVASKTSATPKENIIFSVKTNIPAQAVLVVSDVGGVFALSRYNNDTLFSEGYSFTTSRTLTAFAHVKDGQIQRDDKGDRITKVASQPISISISGGVPNEPISEVIENDKPNTPEYEVIKNTKKNVPQEDIVSIFPEGGEMNKGDYLTVQADTEPNFPQNGSVILKISGHNTSIQMSRLSGSTWTYTLPINQVGKRTLEVVGYSSPLAVEMGLHGVTKTATINVLDKPSIFAASSVKALQNTATSGDSVTFVATTFKPATAGQKVILRLTNPLHETEMRLESADASKTRWTTSFPISKTGERPVYAIAIDVNGNHNNMVRGQPVTIKEKVQSDSNKQPSGDGSLVNTIPGTKLTPANLVLSSNGVQYRLTESLISGDLWQISVEIISKPADFSLVKGKFSGSGLLRISGTPAGTSSFSPEGNTWTHQVKGAPGTYTYTPVFKIGSHLYDAPVRTFTIRNNSSNQQVVDHETPAGSIMCLVLPSNNTNVKFLCNISNEALSGDVSSLGLQCSNLNNSVIPKINSNSFSLSFDIPEGKTTCNISALGTSKIITPFVTELTNIDPYIKCDSNQTDDGEIKLNCSLSKAAIANGARNLGLHCGDLFDLRLARASTNSFNQSFRLPAGQHSCVVYAVENNGRDVRTWTKSFNIVIKGLDLVKALYQDFASNYNDKNDSRLRSLISDDWESVGDGTTLADLEMNLRSSFRIFDQVSYTIQNLQIASMGSGKFKATYDVVIKGQIYKNRINHEEKSSVSEEVTVDTNGKAKISKTLNGRFWYVQ